MARYITVEVGCDWPDCDVRAPEGDSAIVTKTVALDGKQAREFLLCEPKHREAFEDVVLPLMQAGIKVENPAKAPARRGTPRSTPPPVPGTPEADSLVCKAEDCERHGRPLHNRTGMAQHVIRAHGYENLAAYEAQYGTVANTRPEPSPTS